MGRGGEDFFRDRVGEEFFFFFLEGVGRWDGGMGLWDFFFFFGFRGKGFRGGRKGIFLLRGGAGGGITKF